MRQTDFSNDEAVGYLADRLARLGVEEALADAGAEPGDTVLIGDLDDAVVFDWDPTLTVGTATPPARAAPTGGLRGDPRGVRGDGRPCGAVPPSGGSPGGQGDGGREPPMRRRGPRG